MLRANDELGREAGSVTLQPRARREPADGLVLEAVRDLDGLHRLAPEWRELMASAGTGAGIYQSYEWAAACAARLKPGTRLCVLTAREQGRLVAIAPLMIDRSFGFATLRWLGGSLAIYGDVLADASVDVPAWLGRAFAELARQGPAQSLRLDNVRTDACIAPYLAVNAAAASREAAPSIDMRAIGSFEAWRGSQSRNTRRSRARRLKQLEAAGSVSFSFGPTRSSSRDLLDRLFAMKRDWAADRKVISRTIWDREFEAIVSSLASEGSGLDARLSVLMLDGRPIAIELGFVTGGTYTSYLGAYDPAFEAFSPGVLQLAHTIAACFEEGLSAFDLQPPADAYKQALANAETAIVNYTLALTHAGKLQTWVAAADPVGLAKRAIKQMPQSCRRIAYDAMHSVSRQAARPNVNARFEPASSLVKGALILLGAGGAVALAIAE